MMIKNTNLIMIALMLSLLTSPFTVLAGDKAAPTQPPLTESEITQMVERLEEIKALDKSGLTRTEKKELRKEVREIKSELNNRGRGVYLSIGALIIVILLLILLL